MSNQRPFDGRQNLMPTGWTIFAKKYLRRHPLCQGWAIPDLQRCLEKATVVDHIVPRFEGGGHDEWNLQPLCKAHSDTKTAEEGHRAWAAKKAKLERQFDFSERHPGLL